MGMNRTDEFRKDAVRIALTSGLRVIRESTAKSGAIAFLC